MTIRSIARIFALLVAFLCSAFPAVASNVNLAEGTSIKASSTFGDTKAAAVADGIVADDSRWLSAAGDAAPWVELTFPKPVKIGAIDIFSGYKNEEIGRAHV